ncbi:hypothetical protein CAEBREN_11106 [Caenorhabditis brenneri]|uniref:Uncharacterized protein n=1 Tax=Caenorhabditis brenneri TaxID=135651 RepID=G0NJ53_CAEBE|nr:hypothetical protein CAEBREN_11106 [Caenorhabditis brenneri]
MVSATLFKNTEKRPSVTHITVDKSIESPPGTLLNRRFPIGFGVSDAIIAIRAWFYVVLFVMLCLTVLFVHKRIENSNMEQEAKYFRMFNDFILKYNRRYEQPGELSRRYLIFVKNVKEFEAEEKKHLGVDLDVNEYTDWTDDELKRMVIEKKNVITDLEAVRFEGSYLESGVKRPASIDWRDQGKLTPIKNQGQCGSCWAFATVAAVEAQHAIKKGQLVSLSEQEMVDCDGRNNGCSGGYRPYAMRFVKENGLESEKEYPYSALKHDQCFLKQNDTRVFIDDFRMLSTNEEDIANWVGTKGPVTFGMNVVKAMYSYRSGIFNPSSEDCAEKSMGAHALTIVGYGGEGSSAFWIVKNSWGTSWGSSGYFRLARGVNSCGLANTVVAPIIN